MDFSFVKQLLSRVSSYIQGLYPIAWGAVKSTLWRFFLYFLSFCNCVAQIVIVCRSKGSVAYSWWQAAGRVPGSKYNISTFLQNSTRVKEKWRCWRKFCNWSHPLYSSYVCLLWFGRSKTFLGSYSVVLSMCVTSVPRITPLVWQETFLVCFIRVVNSSSGVCFSYST